MLNKINLKEAKEAKEAKINLKEDKEQYSNEFDEYQFGQAVMEQFWFGRVNNTFCNSPDFVIDYRCLALSD